MFTIRTVLPYRDHDDSRPTIINQIDNKLITVFSGKIPTLLLQPFVENSIIHGIQKKAGAGKVHIEMKMKEKI